MEFRACNQPWFEMQLLYGGTFRTCCYYSDELRHRPLDIPALWHGDYFRGLRRLIAGGDPANSHCERCDYIKYFARPMFLDIPRSVTGARRRNWERALDHHRNGVVDIDTFPIKYYMQFGLACNLRCVMCNHPQRYIDGENAELSADRMLAMADYLKLADSVHLIGGEPLIIPSAIRFVDGVLANQDLWDVRYVFYTNALNLGDFLDRFLRLERVVITASIDSSGASYEAIRRRSSWATVTGNLERFARLAREYDKPEWEVHVSTILMKSSLLGLPDLFSWCIENGFSTNIVNIGDLDGIRNDSEHIFRDPALLEDVPGWEGALQRSIEMLSRAGRSVEAQRLEHALLELSQGLSARTAGKAQGKAVSADAEWDPVFDAAGRQLIDGLEHHLYGRRNPEGNLALGADGIRFTPTHQRDHLATPFLECGAQGERWMRIVHEWTGPSTGLDPQCCTVIVQDEQFFELSADGVDIERGGSLTVTQHVRVPAHKDRIRLRVTLPSQDAARLPDRIRLERQRLAPT
jgi:hypothetical protein